MSLSVKLGVGTLALGSAVGVGYGAVNYFSQEDKKDPINEPQTTSVKDLIDKKYEYILLNTSKEGNNPDKDHWANIWKNYQTENQTGTDALNLEGWATRGQTDFTDKIKEKCTGLSALMILNEYEKPYKDVTKYCGRRVTIKDQLAKDELRAIDKQGNVDTTWNGIAEKTEQLTKHFTNLEIKTPKSGKITGEIVKNGCVAALAKDKSNKEFSTIYDSFKEVCVTKG